MGKNQDLAKGIFANGVTGVTKSMVGLGSADNTADTAKPISTATQTALNLKADTSVLVGCIMFFPSSSAPSGYLKCNGAAISRSSYSSLFSMIGTIFGAGDGSTTFNLPDARGQFIRSWDDGRGIDSGRGFGSNQAQDWKGFYMMNTGQNTTSYNHNEEYHGKSTTAYNGRTFAGGWAAPSAAIGTKWDTSEIRPTNIALLVCIKY